MSIEISLTVTYSNRNYESDFHLLVDRIKQQKFLFHDTFCQYMITMLFLEKI